MTIRQNLNWLLSRYIKELEDIEYDVRNGEENGVVTLQKAGQANIYRKVIEDLQGVLEGDEK